SPASQGVEMTAADRAQRPGSCKSPLRVSHHEDAFESGQKTYHGCVSDGLRHRCAAVARCMNLWRPSAFSLRSAEQTWQVVSTKISKIPISVGYAPVDGFEFYGLVAFVAHFDRIGPEKAAVIG